VVAVSADDLAVDFEVLRRRENANPEPTTSREDRCDECGARITILTDGIREAGHDRSCSQSLTRLGDGRRSPPSRGERGD
jgi:hypothetical protein